MDCGIKSKLKGSEIPKSLQIVTVEDTMDELALLW